MYEQTSLMKQTARYQPAAVPGLRQERELRELMELASARHWPFQVLGIAPVPTAPVFHNDWWMVPIAQDHSPIPARALERVQAIYEAGIRPKAFLIVHESSQQLPAPVGAPKISRFEYWSNRLAKRSLTATQVAGVALAGVVIPLMLAVVGLGALVALGAVGATSVAAAGVAGAAIALDPCLIAVTEDNVWIQIDYWMA